jgi:hypothetical protein
MSVRRAILVGTAWVNLPVLGIMLGGWALPPYVVQIFDVKAPAIGAAGAALLMAAWFLVPFVAAWLWWSFNVPKWRVWAMERTNDWRALENAAISAGLIWADVGPAKLFARTEIWSKENRKRRSELERSRQSRNE